MTATTCSFLHAADLHLDSPFVGLGRVAPGLARRLRDASLDAFDGLVKAAIDHRVDFVVLAGDLYDGARRGLRAQLRFLTGLRRLDAAGIYTFIAHGNHDPVDEGWSAIDRWPDRVHVFPSDAVASIRLDLPGGPVTVHGISYARREQLESLVPRFHRATTPGLHVAVLHANVGADNAHAAYSPTTVEALAAAGFDYWALGHVHRAAVLRAAAPRIVYPGNLQGRSFKPSERGAKGAWLVQHASSGWKDLFLPLAPCRFEEMQRPMAGILDVPTLVDMLEDDLHALVGQGGQTSWVVRARLTGAGPLASLLRAPGHLAEMLDRLRDAAPHNVHWAELIDESRAAIDIAARRGRDDLEGAVVEAADGLRDRPNELLTCVSGAGRPPSRMFDVIAPRTWDELLERAVERALEQLGGAEGQP
jgi:exonuclease SbcD